ncbi:MAG TPA: hypothetical protein VHO47_04635 [Candidatus Babeliales bacterium]|nr:hypothetical protein [Candidatus Babeliales bacterium]
MKRIALVTLFAAASLFAIISYRTKLSAMVGAGVPLQAADSEAGRAQAEVLDYNFRYGHDLRLLHRAYRSLLPKYPGVLGLTTRGNPPAGSTVLDKYKNPGYMSSAGSSEYASIYLINQERPVGIPGQAQGR